MSAARVMLPPSRDRRRHVPILARTFLLEACARAGRPPMALSGPALARLCSYRWPGNVRELKNALEDAVAVADPGRGLLEPWHLREDIGQVPEAEPAADEPAPPPAAGVAAPRLRPIHEEIRELERTRMAQALAAAGVPTRAAELIGMPLRTFVTKMRRYQLPRGRPPAVNPL
ncbi:MAG TPA: helix-turn-helix domain-containing protein [Polyangiaceae bacterium]|nr:helix-turn-helix domain-containing protein [Polyangiaceae bacterium]